MKKRILLCVTGMSPQIVTETLYALAVQPRAGEQPWIPDEIHLISTASGIKQANLNLLTQSPGWFHQLCRDYTLPAIQFNEHTLHSIQNAQGQVLDDIRNQADNEAAADSIAELVRQLTADLDCELHVSIAGGRKTMGYYLGYALSLYGRPQDQLSHVLVSGAFEGHPEFYYPTAQDKIIHTRGDKPQALNCKDARVELAHIPFVRLRDGIPNRLLQGHANFSETVQLANLAQQPLTLSIDLQRLQARVNTTPLPLKPGELALLIWFAQRAQSDNPYIVFEDHHSEYSDLLQQLWPEDHWQSERPKAIDKALEALQTTQHDFYEYFKTPLSRLNKAFREHLGEAFATRLKIEKPKRGKAMGYSLPAEINIHLTQ